MRRESVIPYQSNPSGTVAVKINCNWPQGIKVLNSISPKPILQAGGSLRGASPLKASNTSHLKPKGNKLRRKSSVSECSKLIHLGDLIQFRCLVAGGHLSRKMVALLFS